MSTETALNLNDLTAVAALLADPPARRRDRLVVAVDAPLPAAGLRHFARVLGEVGHRFGGVVIHCECDDTRAALVDTAIRWRVPVIAR